VLGWGVGQLSVFLLERTALFQQLGGSATITWRFILVAAELGGAMLLIAVLGLAFAAWRALAHSSVTLRTAWARPSREAGWRRWQLDVLLLLFAAWAWWQLQRSGGSLITTPNGVVHIDLLVLAAPTLLLIVGALLFLRLFPFVARGLGIILRRRRGLVPALSTWQLARNPVLYGRLVLLLTLTVGLGVYSQIVNGTITRSQVRHALDVAGADVRIPLEPHDDPATILATIPAAASTLVSRVDTQYLGEQGQSTVAVQDTMVLLGIDGPALSTVLAASGSDDVGWLAALRSLGAATTPLGLPLPAGTAVVEVQLQSLVTEVMVYAKFGGANGERLVALGQPGAAWQDFQAPLPRDLQQPVSLQSFIVAPKKEEVSMSGQPLVFDQLTARVGTTEVPLGSFEQLDGWEAIGPSTGDAHLSATFGVKGDLSAAQLRVATLRPGEWAALRLRVPFTVEGYLAQAAGDTEAHARQPVVRIGDQEFAVKVRQRLGQFPGVADQPTALIASRDHLQALLSYGKPTTERPQELAPSDPTRFQSDLPTSLSPTALWVALQPGAQPRLGPNAVTKATALFVQQADPLGNGLYVALVLGFGCALLFSLIGFLTSNALTIQARALDWAVLGSLGLARRELLWIIAAEQGVVLGGSLVGGSVVGLLLAALTRPLLQVVAGNIANEPAHVDWLGLLLLLGGLLLAFAIALVAMLVNVQRRGLTRALRLGEG
nr:hypothetical protein [Herpetosiphonaceae bacterium]